MKEISVEVSPLFNLVDISHTQVQLIHHPLDLSRILCDKSDASQLPGDLNLEPASIIC